MANVSGLVSEVDALEGVVDSAIALIDGFVAKMEAAIAAALEANDGADLSAITAEVDQIKAKREALAAAVASHS